MKVTVETCKEAIQEGRKAMTIIFGLTRGVELWKFELKDNYYRLVFRHESFLGMTSRLYWIYLREDLSLSDVSTQ